MTEKTISEAAEIEALLLSRTYMYTLFHKLLGGYPNAELISALTSTTTLDVIEEYSEDNQTMAGFLGFLKNFNSSDAVALADDFTGEYTRMFVGPGKPEVFPYESPYLTNEATYFQENTVKVRAAYKAFGMKPKRLGHVPDDHIALECALMAALSERTLSAFYAADTAVLTASLGDAASFCAAHLAWTGKLAIAARHTKTAKLYPQVLEALDAFIKVDSVFMGEALAWVNTLEEGDMPESAILGERPHSFETVRESLEALRSINLTGIEENELIVSADVSL
ncbi:MAG: molecular chaperone TorD family protein [Coriobacteriales bacterium]|nr:molecular chaperone TorD family protein [Coriobacteriales bacterium]